VRIDLATGEAEMNHHTEFQSAQGRHFALDDVKYMQKDQSAGVIASIQDLSQDYTTLYCHVTKQRVERNYEWVESRIAAVPHVRELGSRR
jgi:hypothetical protein